MMKQHTKSLRILPAHLPARAAENRFSGRALGPVIGGLMLALSACTHQPNGAPPMVAAPSTLNVADAAIAGGDPSMALSISRSVLANAPDNVDALVHEGDAYYALQRCPDAMAAYSLALKADPRSSDAETGLGRCLLKTDAKAAEAALALAVRDNPANAAAWNDLGIARDLQGNFAGAITPYQQALLTQPGSVATEVNLGLSLALSGNGREALQYLGPLAIGQDATAKIREDYAAALIASGRDAEAREVLSVDLTPDQVNGAMAGLSAVLSSAQANATMGGNEIAPSPGIAPAAPVAAAALPGTPLRSPDAADAPSSEYATR